MAKPLVSLFIITHSAGFPDTSVNRQNLRNVCLPCQAKIKTGPTEKRTGSQEKVGEEHLALDFVILPSNSQIAPELVNITHLIFLGPFLIIFNWNVLRSFLIIFVVESRLIPY